MDQQLKVMEGLRAAHTAELDMQREQVSAWFCSSLSFQLKKFRKFHFVSGNIRIYFSTKVVSFLKSKGRQWGFWGGFMKFEDFWPYLFGNTVNCHYDLKSSILIIIFIQEKGQNVAKMVWMSSFVFIFFTVIASFEYW